MPSPAVRWVKTIRDVSTYKVEDAKVEHGEAVVIVIEHEGDEPAVQCLTCNAYKCNHCRYAMQFHLFDRHGFNENDEQPRQDKKESR